MALPRLNSGLNSKSHLQVQKARQHNTIQLPPNATCLGSQCQHFFFRMQQADFETTSSFRLFSPPICTVIEGGGCGLVSFAIPIDTALVYHTKHRGRLTCFTTSIMFRSPLNINQAVSHLHSRKVTAFHLQISCRLARGRYRCRSSNSAPTSSKPHIRNLTLQQTNRTQPYCLTIHDLTALSLFSDQTEDVFSCRVEEKWTKVDATLSTISHPVIFTPRCPNRDNRSRSRLEHHQGPLHYR